MFNFLKKKKKLDYEDGIITFEFRMDFPKKVTHTIEYDLKMSKNFNDNIWLWDTSAFVDQAMEEAKELKISLFRTNLVQYIRYLKWLSVRLKMIGDDKITELIQEYVKYGIKHYDAVLYGTKIIEFRNGLFPELILDAYCQNKYGHTHPDWLYNPKDEFVNYYHSIFKPKYIFEKEFSHLSEDGTQIIQKEREEFPYKTREEEKAFIDRELEKMLNSMTKEERAIYDEMMERVK